MNGTSWRGVDALARRLDSMVSRIGSDAALREMLANDGESALAHLGLPSVSGVGSLPVGLVCAPRPVHPQVLAPKAWEPGLPVDDAPPLEARLICYGVRPAALLHGPEMVLATVGRWLRSLGLVAILSPDEYDPVPDRGKGGFSNLAGQRGPARPGARRHRRLVVATSEADAVIAWLALAFGWERLLGLTLGYPPCCVTAFEERWPTASRYHDGDLIPLLLEAALEGSVASVPDWRSSVHARYAGPTLVSHFPCRLGCAATRQQAERTLAALAILEPANLADMVCTMTAPAILGGTDGLAILRGATVTMESSRGVRLAYDPAEAWVSDPGSPIGRAVLDANTVVADRTQRHVAFPRRPPVAAMVFLADTAPVSTPAARESAIV